MSTIQPSGGEMKAITISRQYGSGGGEIGARLARRLNWHLIDHELVARVARALGIPEQQAEAQDEYAKGFIARVVSQFVSRSEEHTSELQSRRDLVCRLLLEKKKKKIKRGNESASQSTRY